MGSVTIGGVVYNYLEGSTLEQDAARTRILEETDVQLLEMRDGEPAEKFVLRIITELISSGKAFALLGCFLAPEGVTWTKEVAEKTAATFRQVTDPEDKNKIRNALLPLLNTFFVTGLSSVVISRRYSSQLRGIVGQPRRIAGPSTWVSGLLSRAWSLVGILFGRWRSPGGRSVKPS